MTATGPKARWRSRFADLADQALIVLRLAQFAAAAILMGSSLFLVYGLAQESSVRTQVAGARRLVIWGALGLAAAAALGLLAETAVMAGSFNEALKPASLEMVGTIALGKAAIVRIACSLLGALLLLVARAPGRWTWATVGALGAVATASFAWSGHGATSDGPGFWIHMVADVLHSWGAAAWIGALFVFDLLLRDSGQTLDELARTHRSLSRFSTAGTLFVVTLLATGLINSWYLVGPQNVGALTSTRYGWLLLLKIAAFAGMLALAAANRFKLTPRLHGHLLASAHQPPSLAELRRSVAIETMLGLTALALVAWFGTLEPPAAM